MGFTGDLLRHQAALRRVVGAPDLLLMCRTTHSSAEIARVGTKIPRRGLRESGTIGWDHLLVHLRADQPKLADQLIARFGGIVVVQLGNQPYRQTRAQATAPPRCPKLPSLAPLSLSAHLTLDTLDVAAGTDLAGTVSLRNDGAANVTLNSGEPELTYVMVPGTDIVVAAGFDGAIAGVGIAGTLHPAASIPIHVIGTTATCTAGASPALTPGAYEVMVAVPIDEANPQRGGVRSNRVPLTLR